MKLYIPLISIIMLLNGCGGFEYSPNQVFSGDSPKEINKRNIKRLAEEPGDDRIRFVLTGDSQRAYRNAEDMVSAINKLPEIDFVLLAGDISDFGLSQEMEWIDRIFSKLNRPYIGVIGNHDLVANGERAFKRMFGELNFSFVYNGVKFVCHNTNSRESSFSGNVPDLVWLKQQFLPEPEVNAYVAVSHVPPGDADFDEDLEDDYIKIINNAPNTLASLYAHQHRSTIFYPGNQNHIPYVVTDPIVKKTFVLIEIFDGKITFQNINF
jgi:Icc protein